MSGRAAYRAPIAGRPAGTRIRIAVNGVLRSLGWHAAVRLLEQLVVADDLPPLEPSSASLGTL